GLIFNRRSTTRYIVSNPDLIDDWAGELETSFTTDQHFDLLRFDPDDTLDKLYESIEDDYLDDQSDIISGYNPSSRVSVTYTAGMNLGAAVAEAVNEHTDDFGSIDLEAPASRVVSYLDDRHDLPEDFGGAVIDGARYHHRMTSEDDDYHSIGSSDRHVNTPVRGE
ncbi:MAG: hypothetical protein SVU32_01665, partial [Candidatus Nanohaloarchaea archaeon]|nr:hypothetical protein [Candidatus Nanohaloarchaea archaeon]